MDVNYKLVQLVDPTKCKPKIRDKFAKLTLSSNKKRQGDIQMQHQIREGIVHSNVSRNLLCELLTDDESDGEPQNQVENRLLRTDSSPSDRNLEKRKPPLDTTGSTHCSEVDKSLEMEPLMVSGLDNNVAPHEGDDVIEKLSSRVSLMVVGTAPVTISSSSSDIVSTENQEMDTGPRFSGLLRQKSKNEPEVSICISSSESEDDSEAPITISDSSEGEDAQYEVNVSNSVSTSIHQTTDAAKSDRMAAFLRDVRLNYGLPVDSPEQSDVEKRQREIAIADTEPMTMETDSRSAGTGTAGRIATADTESMTMTTTTHKKFSMSLENDPITSPKDASERRMALNDTEDMTRASETMQSSPHYAPVMKVTSELLDDSIQKINTSVPDDSLTIAETSEEEESKEEPETQGALKRSESHSKRISTESSSSSGQDTQFHINISAKINIKIQVSQQIDEPNSSDSTNHSRSINSIEEQPHSSAQKAKPQSMALVDVPHSPPEPDIPPKSPGTVENKSPDDFMQKAQRILTELYGNNWKTPEVMRSLKKTTAKKNRVPTTSSKTQVLPPSEPQPEPPSELKLEPPPGSQIELIKDESALDDFSIFRRNIPQDLDSTRLPPTPIAAFKAPKAVDTRRQPITNERTATPHVQKTRTKSGREVRPRWRAIVDSDTESEGENASDGDKSWSKSDAEDLENKRSPSSARSIRRKQKKNLYSSKNDNELVYLDLSKGEVEVQHNVSASPPANHDEKFSRRLEDILKTCRITDKPKIECTPNGRTKRKLFTAALNDDDENIVTPFESPIERLRDIDKDLEIVSISGAPLPAKFEPFNKHLESVKTGQPIFKIQTPKVKRDFAQKSAEYPSEPKTPKSVSRELRVIGDLVDTPSDKYGFLKSLDLCVGKSLCHPNALYYRDNYRSKKDELSNKLYEIYNNKCFNQQLNVPIKWNKKLTNTAGRCMNKKRMGERSCVIELSEKVLTSADRLRCTLIHELCHAATWIFNGEGGHNATWKAWARKANETFPELPKIGVCHQYDIEYKYTYKCTLCAAKSHAHSKSKKVENIRCSYCHGAIEVYLNKKDKEGNTVATPVREPIGFAKFVKDKYKEYKRPDLKHADIMKILSNEFASLKVNSKS